MKEYILTGLIGHQPHSNYNNIEVGLVIVYLILVIILLYKMQNIKYKHYTINDLVINDLLIVYVGGGLMRFLSVFYCALSSIL